MLYRFTRKLTTYPYYTILGIFITALILDESIIKILICVCLHSCARSPPFDCKAQPSLPLLYLDGEVQR